MNDINEMALQITLKMIEKNLINFNQPSTSNEEKNWKETLEEANTENAKTLAKFMNDIIEEL